MPSSFILTTIILLFFSILSIGSQYSFPSDELNALHDLYIATSGINWAFNSNYQVYGYPWNFSQPSPNPCSQYWQGIVCTSNCSISSCNVEELFLNTFNLIGTFPHSIGSFRLLSCLDLGSNQLFGTIPHEIGNLQSATVISLDSNQLEGAIPASLGNITNLYYLYFSYNKLSSRIPSAIGKLKALVYLYFDNNELTGTIPLEITTLPKLQYLYLENNQLQGTIPQSLSNLKQLIRFYIDSNQFVGSIPDDIGTMTNLQTLHFSYNQLTGTIPASICNLKLLEVFEISQNYINGSIPSNIGQLTSVTIFTFDSNKLSGTIPVSLGDCTLLQYLYLENNNLHGPIPNSFGQLVHLVYLILQQNQLSGTIPSSFGNFQSISYLFMDHNQLIGTLPDSLGRCKTLTYLYLQNNMLNGTIPASYGQLTNLQLISVCYNQLTGSLPFTIGNWKYMAYVILNNNQLTGTLPMSIGNWTGLIEIYLFDNHFHGTIPSTVQNFQSLMFWQSGDNMLSGTFPAVALKHWTQLEILYLYFNRFTGTFPDVFESYTQLSAIIMYDNQFSGTFPRSLSNCRSLTILDFHTNQFSGSFPLSFRQLTQIQNFFIYYNFFSDTIAFMSTWVNLFNMNISLNAFNGELVSVVPAWSRAIEVDLSVNFFAGTIGSVFQNIENLTLLMLRSNQFGGQVEGLFNLTLQPLLAVVDISDNEFTGSIPSSLFTLPIAYSTSAKDHHVNASLVAFAAVKNCLTGSIPDSLCSCTALTSIALDGLHTASTCQQRFFPDLATIRSYQLSSFVTGSIPLCLFSALPALKSLHLSGNGMTGLLPDIPSDNTSSSILQDLVLSYNQFSGSIPLSIQERIWSNLDLSFNKLDGVLSSEIMTSSSSPSSTQNASLTLVVNRFSGEIPSSLLDMVNIDILQGNLFSCSMQSTGNKKEGEASSSVTRWSLPSHDNHAISYTCGSDAVNLSLFVWLTVVGGIAAIIISMYYCSTSYLTSTSQIASIACCANLQSAVKYSWETVLEWYSIYAILNAIIHDKDNNSNNNNTDHISPDTSPLNNFISSSCPSSVSSSSSSNTYQFLLSLYYLQQQQILENDSNSQQVFAWCQAVYVFGNSMVIFRKITIWITLFSIMILLPCYGIMSIYYSSHDYSYAWVISLGYLSGILPAIFFFLLMSIFYLLFTSKLHTFLVQQTVTSSSSSSHRETSVVVRDITEQRQADSPSRWRYLHQIGLELGIFLLNTGVVMTVNIAYVYLTTLNLTSQQMICIVLSISLFKIFWSNVMVLGVFAKGLQSPWYFNIPSSADDKEAVFHKAIEQDTVHRVQFLVYLLILNNILAPFLAEAFTDPTCFYYVVQSPPSVSAGYDLVQCQEFAAAGTINICYLYVTTQRVINYIPPFIYSFQCSSTLLTDFMAVFVYRYLFSGVFGPVRLFVMKVYLEHKANNKMNKVDSKKQQEVDNNITASANTNITTAGISTNNPMVEMIDRPSLSVNRGEIESKYEKEPRGDYNTNFDKKKQEENAEEVESITKIVTADDNSSAAHNLSAQSTDNSIITLTTSNYLQAAFDSHKEEIIFSKESFVIRMIGDLAVLLTFGIVFPPLAVVICFSIVVTTLTNQLIVGRFVISHIHFVISSNESDQEDSINVARYHVTQARWSRVIEEQCGDLMKIFWPTIPSVAFLSSCFFGFFLFDILGDKVGVIQAIWILIVMTCIPFWIWIFEKALSKLYLMRVRISNK